MFLKHRQSTNFRRLFMEAYFMGIDTGTQGVRVAVSNKEGVLLFEDEKKWETLFPIKGWAEQNPLDWWDAISGPYVSAPLLLPCVR